MKKAELIHELAPIHNMSRPEFASIVNDIFGLLGDELAGRREVNIPGFGSFKIVERKARNGHNPKTGEKIFVPASWTVRFKVSKTIKDELNLPLVPRQQSRKRA